MSQKKFTINTGLDIVNGGDITGVTDLTASGNVSVGNVVISNNSIFNLAGPKVTNGDLSHGSTSGLSVVANGDGNATVLYNTYGNVDIFASDTGANVYTYSFGDNGNVSFPGDLSVVGNVTGNYFVGNGSQLTGIAVPSGDKIVNGTSNVEIPIANSSVFVNADGAQWIFGTDASLTVPGDIVSNLHIGIGATDDVNITGGDKNPGTGAEGGDVNVFAGDGAHDTGSGPIAGSGGDVTIIAGDGGTGNVHAGGFGGVVNIIAGPGGDNGTGGAGHGGDINITAGEAGFNNGDFAQGNVGGDVSIEAGATTLLNGNGGGITLTTGVGGPLGLAGSVSVNIPLSDLGTGGTWTFDGTGTLNLPGGTGTVESSANNISIYSDAGQLNGMLMYDTGAEIYALQDFAIFTDNANASHIWRFYANGSMTAPGAINVGDMSIGELPGYITATANTGIILNVSGPDGGFVVDYIKEDGNANTSQGELAFSSETGNTTYRISLTDDAGDGFATKIWRFDGTGNITLPSGGSVYSQGFTPSGNPGNTIVLNPHGSGSITNQKLMLYPTAGDGDHLHMTTGNLYQTELFLGSDDFYVKLANTGNVIINSNDSVGNIATWTFDTTGTLTVPGEGIIQSLNDTVILQSKNTTSGNIVTARFGTNGGLYFEGTEYPQGWLNLTNSSGDANISSPSGSLNIDAANGTSGAAGKDINITAGDADQTDYYATAGGDVNIQGGMGAFNDGGGGGPGGNINIVAGTSADPAGHAGNITITSGSWNWQFYNNGNLYVPGQINGDNNGNLIIDGAGYGNGYISLPAGSFGGEQIAIVNDFSLGNGIALTTNGGTWHFDNAGDLTANGNITGNYFIGNGSQLLAVNANTVDVLNTNGLTTTFYPTFVENRDSAEIVRADVDLTYRTDTNTLGVGNLTVTGLITATGNISGGNILTGGNLSVTGNITGNTAGYSIGYRDIPQVSFSANATAALADAGKHYYSTTAGNLALTLPDNSTTAFPTGTSMTIVVQATGNVLVNAAAGVTLYLGGSSTSGNRVVGPYGMASVLKVAANVWFINGTGVY